MRARRRVPKPVSRRRDGRSVERDGRPAVEFSFEGSDEGDRVSGRGWAIPDGEQPPSPSDCYRFALSTPHIDVSLAAPKDGSQLDEALVALERGPMEQDELAWMRRVGAGVRDAAAARRRLSPIDMLDRLVSGIGCGGPKQLASG